MPRSFRPLVVVISLLLAFSAQAAKPAKPAAPVLPVEFELAHNLGPVGEESLQAIVDRFNKESNGNLKLTRLQKDEKPVGLNLIRHYDMSEILSQSKEFTPLASMMAKAGQPLNVSELSNELKAGVVDAKGKLVALPIVYSTPVLFYNKNAFRKAGLDPEQPPKTWLEMQGMLDKLQEAGYTCPYTTSWPVWVHVDNVSAVSGVPAMTDKGVLAFNGLPQVKHIAMMTTWSKAGYFRLFGRRDEASKKFNDGECAMITTDSREYTNFREAKGVELGVVALPYHDDVYGGRQSTLADGASLWVGAGRSKAEYKQAARFISFLLAPEMQVEMVRAYGGLPLTAAGRAAVQSKILSDGDKTLQVAYASLKGSSAKFGTRVANIDPVRIITNEQLEAVWADKVPAKAALDTSVSLGNQVLGAKPALKKAQPF